MFDVLVAFALVSQGYWTFPFGHVPGRLVGDVDFSCPWSGC
jgi:hypothetical protein